ncbi:TA system toxin CbtA family protein [Xenorhabdus szentirmaii]|uniref:Toxin-antitoxin system protein n=1 Tax=Xenorhabdus szentirmaii DSM 16338 TaxID=1427518 RepID=W1IZ58_9GAMM|nr:MULTISPECIES: TA system toxin CbtA family protein [Xenorhabdus]MBD2806442.1 toxin-antitoxin protein [Xenorhabdus sp. ZM]MBD2822434.1 toxin-antitoxin protein [Xenorhabdus sp. 42]MBD2826949.1 toxin-antitoxin protein [Xenorhabdus sp. 5]PHM30885.1 toxin-antitoxin protein [Xenorhabdus szentirmaii DSM 16338]PHM40370.1 toxin-antitoxin protein [Xenorhabdus szentirmaii]
MEPLKFTVWQVIAACLLKRHFGLSLKDTVLCETDTVAYVMQCGIRPYQAINDMVDKYNLNRLDNDTILPGTPYLQLRDEWDIFFHHGSIESLLSDIH